MKEYYLINDFDGNERIDLESTDEKEAMLEAIEKCGWVFIEREKENESKMRKM